MIKNNAAKSEIVLYKGIGVPTMHVTLEGETLWLNQLQMGKLFGKDFSTISRHIKEILKEGELKAKPTIRKVRIIQKEGNRHVERVIEQYNLDMILSVGYRVNSKQGTRFRQWATSVLRQHLVQGYTIHQRRLKEGRMKELAKLEKTVAMIRSAIDAKELSSDEAKGLLHVVTDYARTWAVLHQYDEGTLAFKVKTTKRLRDFEEDQARNAIEALAKDLKNKGEAGDVFGREQSPGALASILRNLHQTFAGQALYMSVEERAAHLLYFVIKDHPFVDGNKRIGSLLFVLFLKRHGKLLRDGERRINDSALVAIALLIAQSKPADKETMISLVQNLL
jgi:prophage maintenance system killer protein